MQGSFPRLQRLMLSNTGLSGQLPTGWGSQKTFPSMVQMDLSVNLLQGGWPMMLCRYASLLLHPQTARCISTDHYGFIPWCCRCYRNHVAYQDMLGHVDMRRACMSGCILPARVKQAAVLHRKSALQLGHVRGIPSPGAAQHLAQRPVRDLGDRVGQ